MHMPETIYIHPDRPTRWFTVVTRKTQKGYKEDRIFFEEFEEIFYMTTYASTKVHATIIYRHDDGYRDVKFHGTLADLAEAVELGPHWGTIASINIEPFGTTVTAMRIQLNRLLGGESGWTFTVEKAEQL